MALELQLHPEIMEALKNPKVSRALQSMMSNPMGAMNDPAMKDPEVVAAMKKIMPKLQSMMGGMFGGGGMPFGGGMPGGMTGGMPGGMPGGGMPGTAAGGSSFEVEEEEDDADDLD